MTWRTFLVDMGPVFLVLLALLIALRTWRWNRQRPLTHYDPHALESALRFLPALHERYIQRGTISYRELHAANATTRRLIRAELKRRRQRG